MDPLKETVVYISREMERTVGIEPSENYRVIAGDSPYGRAMRKLYPSFVTLVEERDGKALGTGDLIKTAEAAEVVSSLEKEGKRPYIMVFKNTIRIEPLIRERGWTLINPPADTSEQIENKVSQVMWLGPLESYLPPHRLQTMKKVEWKGEPFIVQWAHGHTGTGTILVDSEESLKALKDKFPERRARVSRYIAGPSFTVNIVVTPDRIEAGSLSYQITGLAPFADGKFMTVGNDWSAVRSMLTADDIDSIRGLIFELAEKMRGAFWRGLFGIDLIKDQADGRLYLIEINARQPASAVYESALEQAERAKGAIGLTTFEAHILSLLGQPITKPIIEITEGAQIVQRVTKDVKSVSPETVSALEKAGWKTVSYGNTREGEDLLRIQSAGGIMSGHGILNESGQRIADILKGSGR